MHFRWAATGVWTRQAIWYFTLVDLLSKNKFQKNSQLFFTGLEILERVQVKSWQEKSTFQRLCAINVAAPHLDRDEVGDGGVLFCILSSQMQKGAAGWLPCAGSLPLKSPTSHLLSATSPLLALRNLQCPLSSTTARSLQSELPANRAATLTSPCLPRILCEQE